MNRLEETSLRVKNMIEEFQFPWHDAMHEVMLIRRKSGQAIADTGIFISANQSENYYSDIFQFWVRAFFCFVENTGLDDNFKQAIPNIDCIDIANERFEKEYKELISEHVPETNAQFTLAELEKRKFGKAYMVLNTADFKSAVAESDGEYLAYFKTCD